MPEARRSASCFRTSEYGQGAAATRGGSLGIALDGTIWSLELPGVEGASCAAEAFAAAILAKWAWGGDFTTAGFGIPLAAASSRASAPA